MADKYKVGDRFIIEINDRLKIVGSEYGIYPLRWMVKGLDNVDFEEEDLDRLKRYDPAEAYRNGWSDALGELMEYTYGMLTAEKFGLQQKIKSMMEQIAEQTEPKGEEI